MPRLSFTQNIQRHVACPSVEVQGTTVREVLDAAFASNERARGYVLDDQGGLRKHMVVFIDGEMVADREHLSDQVPPEAEISVPSAVCTASNAPPFWVMCSIADELS